MSLANSSRIIHSTWGTLAYGPVSSDSSSAYRKRKKSKPSWYIINPCKGKGRRRVVGLSVVIHVSGPVTLVVVTSHLAVALSLRQKVAAAWVADVAPATSDIEARALFELDKRYESTEQTCFNKVTKIEKAELRVEIFNLLVYFYIGTPVSYSCISIARTQTQEWLVVFRTESLHVDGASGGGSQKLSCR